MDLWTEDIMVWGEMESGFSGSLRVRGTATGKHFKGGRGERKKKSVLPTARDRPLSLSWGGGASGSVCKGRALRTYPLEPCLFLCPGHSATRHFSSLWTPVLGRTQTQSHA